MGTCQGKPVKFGVQKKQTLHNKHNGPVNKEIEFIPNVIIQNSQKVDDIYDIEDKPIG